MKALEIRKAVYCEKNTLIADSYTQVGSIKFGQELLSDSIEYFEKSLNIYEEQLGPHSKTIHVSNLLTECYQKNDMLESQ